MINSTQIEMLLAVVSGSRRRAIQALITDLYPVIAIEEAVKGIIEVDEIKGIVIRFDVDVMAGITSVEEITLESFGAIEYTETEESMAGLTTVEEITLLTFGLVEYTETEESMTGIVEVEEITLIERLVAYTETEEPVAGITTIEEITLTTP